MTKHQLEHFRARLRAYADRARGTVQTLEDQARVPVGGEVAGNLSDAPIHMGDLGTETYDQEMNATLLENEEHVLAEVTAALGRIDNGTFGQCENCGRPIPIGRLEAVPYARYCVRCSELLGAEQPANLNAGRAAVPPATGRADVAPNPGAEDREPSPERPPVVRRRPDDDEEHPDIHAVGAPGGGSAVGGLAGTNIGIGAAYEADLEEAMAGGVFDEAIEDDEEPEAYGGPSGGAVGGTPANKRATGGKTGKGIAPQPDPGDSPTGP
ncbi:MAG TPA: TraR/DksA C4-type zinc finger protein [Gemmataceae bacterium]|nr:TraR/DksA C4-type zinc finger protein [Gemmataceae bacterium]